VCRAWADGSLTCGACPSGSAQGRGRERQVEAAAFPHQDFQHQVGLPRGEPLAANFATVFSPKGVEVLASPARDPLDFHAAAQTRGMPARGAQDGSGGPRQDMSLQEARRLSEEHRRRARRPAHDGQLRMSRHWTPRTFGVRERQTENIMRLVMWHGSISTGA
jgi:hypothetical protein